MTLALVRLRVSDEQVLQEVLRRRLLLKRSYGCTGTRIIADREDPTAVVAMIEFRTFAQAHDYLQTSVTFLSADDLTAITILSVEYFEDIRTPAAAADLFGRPFETPTAP